MTSKKEVNIGILGLGTVGSGVWKILEDNRTLLEERTGVSLNVKKILVQDTQKKRRVSVPSGLLTTRPGEILEDPGIQVVVELLGGISPAGDYVLKALEVGKNVVTANKALMAAKGGELLAVAQKKGLSLEYEASVAGGIPLLKSIREGFIGNRILEVYGIINGTCNFILSEMRERQRGFKEVLAIAQKEGYAEQDPSFDIEGTDAAQKLAILVSLCYGVKPPQSGIYTEGISCVTPLDMEFARKLGYVIKLLAMAREHNGSIQARVHPTMIPDHHPLADVGGVFNAVYLKGDAVGEMMFMGRGAGMMPTASAVVSDIAMVARGMPREIRGLRQTSIQPIEELSAEYYLRFSVVDKPGVLAQIARHLGEGDISIASVYQKERDLGSKVPIVIMTHEAREKNIKKAIAKIDDLDEVLDKTVLIRVQRFPA